MDKATSVQFHTTCRHQSTQEGKRQNHEPRSSSASFRTYSSHETVHQSTLTRMQHDANLKVIAEKRKLQLKNWNVKLKAAMEEREVMDGPNGGLKKSLQLSSSSPAAVELLLFADSTHSVMWWQDWKGKYFPFPMHILYPSSTNLHHTMTTKWEFWCWMGWYNLPMWK